MKLLIKFSSGMRFLIVGGKVRNQLKLFVNSIWSCVFCVNERCGGVHGGHKDTAAKVSALFLGEVLFDHFVSGGYKLRDRGSSATKNRKVLRAAPNV